MPTISPLPSLSINAKFASIPSLEETLKVTNQPAKREKIREMIDRQDDGRGIRTRGWSARSPTRGKERHQLKAECGDKCFLLPDEEKFPICASPRITGGTSTCEIDCGGVASAYIRARQWGYDDVADKAKKIVKECEKGGLSRFVPSSPIPKLSNLPSLTPAMQLGGNMKSKKKAQANSCGCGN